MSAVAARAPRLVQVEMRVVVRYLQASSFEDAKLVAIERTRGIIPDSFARSLRPFASRECDGSYTVEFR